ncbi:unnamed protein product [Schistocephalus solidus]|uniref:MIR domain-containing protein n=1 Tax=Schistocephalus solidus TaxID=70667 RepID=A0A183SSH6_SCHSO|nr:unnamed protein product [Schistocephalus solidus]
MLAFKEHLDDVFPDILFTMEENENDQVAFLDVFVCRKEFGGLNTKVFRKATNTTQVMGFSSNHPTSHKRSYVCALYQRVATPSSQPEDKIGWVFRANFVNICMRNQGE